MRLVGIEEFRTRLAAEVDVVALCGAGISMPAPTALPSGNELRDICVETLIKDDVCSEFVDRLLRSAAYTALLPEAVLQEVGFFAQIHIDRLIARGLSTASPNQLHRAISARFDEIFTTNFETCFERAGARNVYHLHGSVDNPNTLQSGIWRLGRTSVDALQLFKSRAHASTIFVAGYSLRDSDVLGALAASSSLKIMYLSHTADIPPVLSRMSGHVIIAIGSLDKVLMFEDASTASVPIRFPKLRQPAISARALALMYLYGTLGDVESIEKLITLYKKHLNGRYLLRALGVLADTLRAAQRFEEAFAACQRAASLPSYNRDSNLDLQSYILTLMALCEHEGSAHLEPARLLLLKSLSAMNRFGRRDLKPETPQRVAVWRAKIANNLGNVERDAGRFHRAEKLYRFSIDAKISHSEEGAAAQSFSNLGALQITTGRFHEARMSLGRVVEAMEKSPQIYICRTAIYDNALAIAQTLDCAPDCIAFDNTRLIDVRTMIREKAGDLPILIEIVEILESLQTIIDRLFP